MNKNRSHVLHDELLIHVGDIIVSFNSLEYELKDIAGWLLHWDCAYPQMTAIATSELSFRQTCSLVMSLALERFGEGANAEMFRGWLAECHRLEDERNKVAHCTWGDKGSSDGKHLGYSRWKPSAKEKHGLRYAHEDVDARSLEATAVGIQKLTSQLWKVRANLMEMIHPPPKGWPIQHILEPPLKPRPTGQSPGLRASAQAKRQGNPKP